MGEKNVYRLLVGKPEGRRPLGRPRRKWVDNIRMDLGEAITKIIKSIIIQKQNNNLRIGRGGELL
jgi:hypothetical protein